MAIKTVKSSKTAKKDTKLKVVESSKKPSNNLKLKAKISSQAPKKPEKLKPTAQVKTKVKLAADVKKTESLGKVISKKPTNKSIKSEAPKESKEAKRKQLAAAALKAAMSETSSVQEEVEEEEFDPAAFYAASGINPAQIRSHVMRKERVDTTTNIRYRLLNSPLITNAEMINLSKGGLCLVTPVKLKAASILRVEIPLPHTSELFAIQAEVVWSNPVGEQTNVEGKPLIHTGLKFMTMSLAKLTVINNFIQQRRDQIVMSKIGLQNFGDSAPVAGLD